MGNGVDRSNGYAARSGQFLDRLPWLVRWAVIASVCLLIVTAGAYVLAQIATRLGPLSIALAATLFLAGLLDPVATRLRRWRLPPALAALLTVLLLLGLLGGAVLLIWRLTADQFSDLTQQLDQGLERTRDFLTGTLPISREQLDQWTRQAVTGVQKSAPDPISGAATVAEAVGGLLLVLVLLFFLLKDGRPMWRWVLGWVADGPRERTAAAGRAGWRTLGAYTRGTMMIAAIDAIGIGIALVVLRVPLALPLAVITFLGGFVPIIGATVAGSIAVLVALAAKGPTTALLVLAAVIAVQQLEGNLLEPLIMKRQVRLHPVVVLLVVTAGTLLGGIVGAFVAVPIAAVLYNVVSTVATDRRDRAAGQGERADQGDPANQGKPPDQGPAGQGGPSGQATAGPPPADGRREQPET
ncbi:AI-2E family transporter [Plantactinospora endophytica]|uniref:AI-2E family transporter n=1 Tax=Plantactinospora endophytica TaxID=673535 RepID=A0ABQ4E7S7_9ACTN|nr:AI-2E family transporter [Plantactinospora endophytica]GIG90772.1 AI-2E family transporter [Plantactinospora endophytica]